jgi:hypothetical protein
MSTGHQCPGHECTRQVPRAQLACPRHWAMVPKPLQREVYAAYRQEPLGERHLAAISAAMEAMNP